MLDQLIAQAGFTHETLAKRLNVLPEQISKWTSWEEIPSVEHCHALADVLGVQLYDVYLALITH